MFEHKNAEKNKAITLEDITKRQAELNARREQLIREQTEAEADATRFAVEAEEAATRGDFEAYKALTERTNDADARAYVAAAQLKSEDLTIPREDYLAAWADYRAKYEERFERQRVELDKARAAFVEAFGALLANQREAVMVREQIGRQIGEGGGCLTYADGNEVFNSLPMKTIPTEAKLTNSIIYNGARYSGDAAFYAYCMDYNFDSREMRAILDVVKNHRAPQPH